MHIYSMSTTSVKNLKLIAQKLWKKLITHSHPVSCQPFPISWKYFMFKESRICQKWLGGLSNIAMHVYSISVTHTKSFISNAQKLWKVDCTNLSTCWSHFSKKNSMFEKVFILSKLVFSCRRTSTLYFKYRYTVSNRWLKTLIKVNYKINHHAYY